MQGGECGRRCSRVLIGLGGGGLCVNIGDDLVLDVSWGVNRRVDWIGGRVVCV